MEIIYIFYHNKLHLKDDYYEANRILPASAHSWSSSIFSEFNSAKGINCCTEVAGYKYCRQAPVIRIGQISVEAPDIRTYDEHLTWMTRAGCRVLDRASKYTGMLILSINHTQSKRIL